MICMDEALSEGELCHKVYLSSGVKMSGSSQFQIELDGKKLNAVQGQTIAEVLLSNQELIFRKTPKNVPRGPFCGMGVCYECQMKINDVPNVRTCIAEATPGCSVETQKDSRIESPEGKQ